METKEHEPAQPDFLAATALAPPTRRNQRCPPVAADAGHSGIRLRPPGQRYCPDARRDAPERSPLGGGLHRNLRPCRVGGHGGEGTPAAAGRRPRAFAGGAAGTLTPRPGLPEYELDGAAAAGGPGNCHGVAHLRGYFAACFAPARLRLEAAPL